MILSALGLAVGQVFDPAFRRVLALGLGLSAALLGAVYALFLTGLQTLAPDALDLPWIGPVTGIDALLGWASLGLMLVLSFFLMFPVAAAFAGLFSDDVAQAVETRHYPHLHPARRVRLGDSLVAAANLAGLVIALNALGIFLFPFAGPAAPFLFWLLNGFLLGRDFFTSIAARRLDRAGARAAWRAHAARATALGALIALPLAVPILNLTIPVIGAAAFTHLVARSLSQP